MVLESSSDRNWSGLFSKVLLLANQYKTSRTYSTRNYNHNIRIVIRIGLILVLDL